MNGILSINAGSRLPCTRAPEDLAFPRQAARTQGFSLGTPRDITVSPDGTRVVFLRSKAGDDPVTCVWMFDVMTGVERCVFDPREHGAGDGAVLTAAERARRERARERASGVTAYTHDRDLTTLVFVEGGRLLVVDAITGEAQELTTPGVPDDLEPLPGCHSASRAKIERAAADHLPVLVDFDCSCVAVVGEVDHVPAVREVTDRARADRGD